MTDDNWIKRNANFEHVNLRETADVVSVQNSDQLVSEFYLYSENFHSSAEQIAEYLLTNAVASHDIAKLDTWFFAVVYLYRQSLELILKAILFKSITVSQARINAISDIGHDLSKCFIYIKSEFAIDSEHTHLRWIEEFLHSITTVDEKSDMFRYPFNHQMKMFFAEQTHIDFYSVRQNLTTAYSILCDLFWNNTSNRSYELQTPRLIVNGGDYWGQVVIGYRFSQNQYYPYIKGYQEAAKFLRTAIQADAYRDKLFLSMCYLYRNAVELGLKRILVNNLKIPYQKIKKKNHSLKGLWGEIRDNCDIEKYANAPKGDTTLIDVDARINQLHIIDKDSTKFRYPVDKNLQFHFPRQKLFSISNVSNYFNELVEFFDGVNDILSEASEFENEMPSESGFV
jgi:HEPN domain-containing protein